MLQLYTNSRENRTDTVCQMKSWWQKFSKILFSNLLDDPSHTKKKKKNLLDDIKALFNSHHHIHTHTHTETCIEIHAFCEATALLCAIEIYNQVAFKSTSMDWKTLYSTTTIKLLGN